MPRYSALILGLLVWSHLHATGSPLPPCTMSGLLKNCEFFNASKGQPFVVMPDGTWFLNPSFKGKRPEPPPIDNDKRFNRAIELFNYAKAALIDEISLGQAREKLRPEERTLIKYIETLKLNSLSIANKEPACAGKAPDAAYLNQNHSLTICEGMLHFPDGQLIKIIAHEIGHSIGPCNSRFPLVKINYQALDKLDDSKTNWPEEIKNNLGFSESVEQMKVAPRGEYALFSHVMKFHDAKSVDHFTKIGLVELIAPAVEKDKHPAQKAYACLTKTKVFREVTAQDVKLIANRYAQGVAIDEPDSVREKLSLKAEQRLSPYAQCIWSAGGRSQMSEAMSDVWGAKVQGRWLTDNPPKSDLEKVAAFSYEATNACRTTGPARAEVESLTLLQITNIADKQIKRVHPSDLSRANLILLDEPRTQQAVQCQPVQPKSCLKLIGRQGPLQSGYAPQTPHGAHSSETER